MNSRVLRRYIILMGVATFLMFTGWAVLKQFVEAPPGDYQVRQGDVLLSDRKYDEALTAFEAALEHMPDHRGALMGRAIVFLQTERFEQAEVAFSDLIQFLQTSLASDDLTGYAVLAAAYANRGILYDRTGRYEQALADYRRALAVDAEAVEGPGLFHKILYGNAKPATVRKRASYLAEQLALPKDERVLRIRALDAEQRMYKP